MTEYIVLIHDNTKTAPTADEWNAFIVAARRSGCFVGGSEIGERVVLGDTQPEKSSQHIVGYMRFDTNDKPRLLELLKLHPVIKHGGSVELCVLPKS